MSTPESPSAPEPAIQRGARLLAEGHPEAAVAVLRGLVSEAPIYAAAHVMLAASLDAAGRPDEGLDAWHRAAFLVPASRLVQRKRRRLDPAPLAGGASAPAAEPAESTEPMGTPPESAPAPAPDTPGSGADALHDHAPPPELSPAGSEPSDTAQDAPRDVFADTADAPQAMDAEPAADVFPDGAEIASPDELFTHIPDATPPVEADVDTTPAATVLEAADPATPPAEPASQPPPRRPARPAPPDWGDLDEPAVAVIPPQDPDAAPPPSPQDPGGWTVLAERERSTPEQRGVVPPVIRPESWAPPDEPTPTVVPGMPTASTPPPAPSAAPGEPALADDLDALIESLDAAPRITPDPDFDGPSPVKEQDDVDDLASETMARIYAAQHQYAAAAVMYERLAARSPENAEDLLDRAAEMRRNAKKR